MNLTIQADKTYILEAGYDSQFSKSLMSCLSMFGPGSLAGQVITIVPSPGSDESVLFCRVFFDGDQVRTELPETPDWRAIALAAVAAIGGSQWRKNSIKSTGDLRRELMSQGLEIRPWPITVLLLGPLTWIAHILALSTGLRKSKRRDPKMPKTEVLSSGLKPRDLVYSLSGIFLGKVKKVSFTVFYCIDRAGYSTSPGTVVFIPQEGSQDAKNWSAADILRLDHPDPARGSPASTGLDRAVLGTDQRGCR
jgi:hypothetical protein